ncbi:MAG: hypothetical protein HY290_29575 [Planctomycetia bacterium]|nr:hypothetical protein [Planctomycetia bacterium]
MRRPLVFAGIAMLLSVVGCSKPSTDIELIDQLIPNEKEQMRSTRSEIDEMIDQMPGDPSKKATFRNRFIALYQEQGVPIIMAFAHKRFAEEFSSDELRSLVMFRQGSATENSKNLSLANRYVMVCKEIGRKRGEIVLELSNKALAK